MNLFDLTTLECSKVVTSHYSTSFTLGIRTLSEKYHLPVYAIYGFVRYADEIVDTFHDHDKAALLQRFKEDTYRALEEKISLNPILHAFQLIVNQYSIPREYIEAFLRSMEMDLDKIEYTPDAYRDYIYGSAEVVGLMCLKVFCEGDQAQFSQLEEPARRLGAAFQKVNFLRDMQSDYRDRGRVYFPGVQFEQFGESDKRNIEADIQDDFDAAAEGIRQLPESARLGVHLAYNYYLKLFHRIKTSPVSGVLTERIRIPDHRKWMILIGTYMRFRLQWI
jgi:15-cis-phytoene synthase